MSPNKAGRKPAIASVSYAGKGEKMRNMSASKRSSWVLVAALGVVGVSHWTAYAASLEDQQQAAGAIVTQAKGLAKVQGTDMDKKRSSVTVKDHSREYKLPIKKWEKGALITKDEKTGGEVRGPRWVCRHVRAFL